MRDAKSTPCAATVWRDSWNDGGCGRVGTKNEDGQWWCYQHAPSAVNKRRKDQEQRWDEERAKRDAHYRREAAVRNACEGISTEALEAGVVKELVEIAKDQVAFGASRTHYRLEQLLTKLAPEGGE